MLINVDDILVKPSDSPKGHLAYNRLYEGKRRRCKLFFELAVFVDIIVVIEFYESRREKKRKKRKRGKN